MSFQLGLAFVMPSYIQEGLPVPSLNYKPLQYNCNTLSSFYAMFITCAALHWTRIFRLTEIIDDFGELMTVVVICGFIVSFVVHFITITCGEQMCMSGNFMHDFFMCRQHKTYGYVTPNMVFMIFTTGLYINGCTKDEECIPQIWDMSHKR
ncbi:C-24(28) sterol reductase [Ceratobasidium sp. 414]|nr:C-24(28) sterol reductase [Ceratobasidium sp. 414]